MQKATPRKARLHNTQLVRKIIYGNGPISRAEIARITRLTPPTVSEVVTGLIESGWVEEVGYAPSSSGRRAILLSVVNDSRQLIGIDLSREDFRGALCNLRGKIQQRIDLPLEGRDGEAALSLVYDLVDSLIQSTSSPLLGIGIGAPGLVNASKGILQQSVNLNWRYIPLRSLLNKRYKLPVYLANDCQVAALGEHIFGNHHESDLPLVVINASWGVGAGILIKGKLVHGSPVGAGEIGHVVVVDNGPLCACGNHGCLEAIASSRAIIQQVSTLLLNDPNTSLRKFITDPNRIEIETICQALNAGNEEVRQIVLEAGRALGVAAANLVGVLGSCRILIRGSMSHFGQLLLDAIREEMDRRTLSSLARVSEVGFAGQGADIVIRGAAALILRQELGVF